MRLLLDTCAVLWAGLARERLSPAASAALTDPGAEVYVATITAAEIACAQARGRIDLTGHWKPWFRRAIEINGWRPLAATLEVVEEAYSLPGPFHADPADRLIAATARIHRLTVVTGDRLLLSYPHLTTVW
ncbi:MAG: type II toxin-antitoxin system VapC family toxin [Deltaproteobacteria bacterium]|nr:type II toxin-antitoxin system VapC family toxin [Deltaproteobacteria bacterium]OIP64424.1 MAG: hypothetical protein AUK30_06670 [Nitrospirae bacterium CG2_30_70_394]PIU77302.1 MAG: hypothetical protein COS73_11310 [Nitrospirae bacterium CG06_land_8_20_14_3_00_70_43]PIW83405.1 MAG: hypothetical protein COZ96_03530 [Nitrospirae bacterium CG_4_8_14_3_um_filter_70_85]PIX82087.1 MAG: hypothetical protein COZ33_12575 [Nitrospirae bacterium CG_4_10_14_3_um_filter_70_108]PJB95659.1 MAG: hypothetic